MTEGPVAPQYLIFETSNGHLSGDTGELKELTPGFRTGFGTLECSNLQVDADGSLELRLGPEKPEGYSGNYICTHKPPSKKNPDGDDRYASYITGRQLFYDWENEEAVALTITPLETSGAQPTALTPAKTAAQLRIWVQSFTVR